MMPILDAVQENMSPFGLAWPLSKGTDNLPVGQATLILLQAIAKESSVSSVIALDGFLNKCRVGRGLYRRTPENTDQNAVDNYIAGCFMSHAKDIYWRCVWRFGIFANDKFEPRAIFARFFGLRPYAKFRAGYSLNAFDRWILKVSMNMTLNDDPTDTSNKCLQVIINYALKGFYPDIDQAISEWATKMADQYPGGLKDLYTYYWGKEHTFYHYAPSDWDFLR